MLSLASLSRTESSHAVSSIFEQDGGENLAMLSHQCVGLQPRACNWENNVILSVSV